MANDKEMDRQISEFLDAEERELGKIKKMFDNHEARALWTAGIKKYGRVWTEREDELRQKRRNAGKNSGNLEKTFIMIKPEHADCAEKIFRELDTRGNRLISAYVKSVPKDVIEEHYSVHRGKPFFGYMTESFIGKKVAIAIYEGEDVIRKFTEMIGPTDPSKAPEYTIRGKYSRDSLEDALANKRPVKNVIHRSDSPEQAEREIKVWERYFLLDYN